MKIERFNEEFEFDKQIDELVSIIYNIIDNNVYTQSVEYGDGDVEISNNSKYDTSKKIIEYLKEQGLLTALTAKKFNI